MMNTGCEAGESAIKFARRWAYTVKGVPDNEAIVNYFLLTLVFVCTGQLLGKKYCSLWIL